MSGADGNLFSAVPSSLLEEQFDTLLAIPAGRLGRIISTGQASPTGFWYDQPWTEWVVVLAGRAGVLFEREASPRELRPGDYLLIPAYQRHRVEWTDPQQPTIWLAVHMGAHLPSADNGDRSEKPRL
jgi:cupin 2 domain-containing protein